MRKSIQDSLTDDFNYQRKGINYKYETKDVSWNMLM